MTHYIETQAKDGSPIRIEVEVSSRTGAGFTRQTPPADLSTEEAAEAYNQTLNTIQHAANGLIDTLQSMEAVPSSASIDFAIKIDADSGAMVAKARDEGQFRVSLSWKQPEPDKDEADESE